jgi:DNA-binding MarR family transcriptional regulator
LSKSPKAARARQISHKRPTFLDAFTLYRLSVASSVADQLLTDLLKVELRLSLAEWRVMLIVGKVPGLSTDGLAGLTTMDKPRVSRAIARLSALGLLNRETPGQDRRLIALSVTAKGAKVSRKCAEIAQAAQIQFLGRLTAKERSDLFSLLAKLSQKRDR